MALLCVCWCVSTGGVPELHQGAAGEWEQAVYLWYQRLHPHLHQPNGTKSTFSIASFFCLFLPCDICSDGWCFCSDLLFYSYLSFLLFFIMIPVIFDKPQWVWVWMHCFIDLHVTKFWLEPLITLCNGFNTNINLRSRWTKFNIFLTLMCLSESTTSQLKE